MKKTKEVITALVKLAEEDRDILKGLKTLAVNNTQYGLAADLRDIEVAKYPDAKSTNKEYKEAKVFNVMLRLLDVNTSTKMTYLVLEAAKLFIKKGGQGNIEDTSKIQAKANKIFG